MEHAIEVMTVEDLTTEELDVFAATMQKMGKGASEYARKRQAVRDGKTNRGFQPSATGHNRTAIALDGKLTLNAGQLQDKIQQVKARTRCYDCGQKGHWRGDRSCPKNTGCGGLHDPRGEDGDNSTQFDLHDQCEQWSSSCRKVWWTLLL